MQFLYFFPNETISSFEAIRSPAVRDIVYPAALDPSGIAHCPNTGGPHENGSTQMGTMLGLISVKGDIPDFRYDKEQQTWQQFGNVWIGYWNQNPPGPDDLVRPQTVPGELVRIQGKEWIIPYTGPMGHSLPEQFVLSVNGTGKKWAQQVDERYRGLMENSASIFERMRSGDYSFIIDRDAPFVASLLSVNYRLGDAECSLLKLLSSSSLELSIRATYGLNEFTKRAESKSAATDAP